MPRKEAVKMIKTICAPFTLAANPPDADQKGPVFLKEPTNRIDFSNSTGAEIECKASGNPMPEIIWIRSDGTAVGDVPGLRQISSDGKLVFPPFRAEDYRQEVHAQVYACLARNQFGTIISRDVHVRAVVAQYYEADVNKEHVIRGNSAVIKCLIPSFVADFVEVVSWHTDNEENFYPGSEYVVSQQYEEDIHKAFVIRGNSAILKCDIPSFVADFVSIVSWHTDQDENFFPGTEYVVAQYYDTDVNKAYVIRANAAILKCEIPSFMADFVSIVSWHTDQNEDFLPNTEYVLPSGELHIREVGPEDGYKSYQCRTKHRLTGETRLSATKGRLVITVVSQFYITEAENEYVIKGNAAVLKCKIPSFVADFVYIEAWVDEEGVELWLVIQTYESEADNEYVIRGNSAVMKCEIPSYVADFVYVDLWLDSEGRNYYPNNEEEIVVHQFYQTRVIDEFVLRGNAATLKCSVPSFVADFISVESWVDEEGAEILKPQENDSLVVQQFFESQVYDEYVIKGNAAIFKCQTPSFVADHLEIIDWLDTEGGFYTKNETVVPQAYTVNVMDEAVLKGNSAILKCHIPSFVGDFIAVASWVEDEEREIYPMSQNEIRTVVQQFYESEVNNEYVIRGNAAVLKCSIPSFVADFVQVVSWQDESGELYATLDEPNGRSVNQFYEAEVVSEYVIKGNTAVLKCTIPSFVADFVKVEAWLASDSTEYLPSTSFVVNQHYGADILMEYVIKGNAAVLKCSIPSFVADFVRVESWIDEEGTELRHSNNYVVNQFYEAEIMTEYVIKGNAAVLKCSIPSFVADFVRVESWIDEDGQVLTISDKYVLPSGELHIREVGPEDGYKSYQCRTKHRLTGETRLSATKGRLVITEPLGSVGPRLSTGNDIKVNIKPTKTTLTLLCLAQAYPVPFFRAPLNQATKLLCPAQAYPVPIFSVSPKITGGDDNIKTPKFMLTQKATLLCPAQAYPVPYFRFRSIQNMLCNVQAKHTQYHLSEPMGSVGPKVDIKDEFNHARSPNQRKPMGSVAPKVDVKDRINWIDKPQGRDFSLLCPAQSYPMPAYSSVPPNVEIKDKAGIFLGFANKTLALLCPGQAYPKPSYRRLSEICDFQVRSANMKIHSNIFEKIEPMGSVAPKVSLLEQLQKSLATLQSTIALFCPAQSYPVPIYSVPPKISIGERRKDAEASVNNSVSIFCPAQSYPVPVYRFIIVPQLKISKSCHSP
uniref:Ig-like domain-containing protein n=1 Tax=Glossina austeni TaxID=7395 RepID=A0A1A9V523_GLOAU